MPLKCLACRYFIKQNLVKWLKSRASPSVDLNAMRQFKNLFLTKSARNLLKIDGRHENSLKLCTVVYGSLSESGVYRKFWSQLWSDHYLLQAIGNTIRPPRLVTCPTTTKTTMLTTTTTMTPSFYNTIIGAGDANGSSALLFYLVFF